MKCKDCLPLYIFIALALFLIPYWSVAQAPNEREIREELNRKAIEFESIPREETPQSPFLFLTPEEITTAREKIRTTAWAKKLADGYLKTGDFWVNKDYDFIKKIIPPWGSHYTYGLGMDLDPIQNEKMRWRGWKDPLHVVATNGEIYPNNQYPDDGEGWIDTTTGKKYFFRSLANGMILTKLTYHEVRDLANAYVLTGNEKYAERALWILDAIATIYPRAYEGPLDYPGNGVGIKDGGRMDRPLYQVARALMEFAYAYELIKSSIHVKEISPSNPKYSMVKNIEINLLMNGADYCMRRADFWVNAGYELNNGIIDYNRGPLIVGALLGISDWVDFALNGPLGLQYAFTNTIDMNGRYFESSSLYAEHTRLLMLSVAEVLVRMRLSQYPKGYNMYNDKQMAQFALTYYTSIQTGGRIPSFGDSGPDMSILNSDNPLDQGSLFAAQQFYLYSSDDQIKQQALRTASLLKTDSTEIPPLKNEWGLFRSSNLNQKVENQMGFAKEIPETTGNTLLFDYGVGILRQGKGFKQRASLMRFGPTLNHGHADELALQFFAHGREFSLDPGYFNTHFLFGFNASTVAHNTLVIQRLNQLRLPSSGGDVESFVSGKGVSTFQVNNPDAYKSLGVATYRRRNVIVSLSPNDSYIVDLFWAKGGNEYDYSLHGFSGAKLNIDTSFGVELKDQRSGSVWNRKIDYSKEMDFNGKVKSFEKENFFFSPPGQGFSFLSTPSFYSFDRKINLMWSASDSTDHKTQVFHFAPSHSELIKAHIVSPDSRMDLDYSLTHLLTNPEQTVQFVSVIAPTVGNDKLMDVSQLYPRDGDSSALALEILKSSPYQGTDYYLSSENQSKTYNFSEQLSFTGNEALVRKDSLGQINNILISGEGTVRYGKLKVTTEPLFSKKIKVLKIENAPLRLLVNIPYKRAVKLRNALVKLNRTGLARPFSILVKDVEKANNQCWLIMNATKNMEAIGVVDSIDSEGNLVTKSPFPRLKPYLFSYDIKTGRGLGVDSELLYNKTFDGLKILNQRTSKLYSIKTLRNNRKKIILQDSEKMDFKEGDQFEVQVFSVGDELEIPTWGQIIKNQRGEWEQSGPSKVVIKNGEKY